MNLDLYAYHSSPDELLVLGDKRTLESKLFFEKFFPEAVETGTFEDIIKTPTYAIQYAMVNKWNRFEIAEKYIAKSAKYSYRYAVHILKDKFPMGEKSISTSSEYSQLYGISTQKRFKLGEPAILKNPVDAATYASNVIKGRWKEAEPIILSDFEAIFSYVEYVVKGRWKDAEPIIMKHKDKDIVNEYFWILLDTLSYDVDKFLKSKYRKQFINFVKSVGLEGYEEDELK